MSSLNEEVEQVDMPQFSCGAAGTVVFRQSARTSATPYSKRLVGQNIQGPELAHSHIYMYSSYAIVHQAKSVRKQRRPIPVRPLHPSSGFKIQAKVASEAIKAADHPVKDCRLEGANAVAAMAPAPRAIFFVESDTVERV